MSREPKMDLDIAKAALKDVSAAKTLSGAKFVANVVLELLDKLEKELV